MACPSTPSEEFAPPFDPALLAVRSMEMVDSRARNSKRRLEDDPPLPNPISLSEERQADTPPKGLDASSKKVKQEQDSSPSFPNPLSVSSSGERAAALPNRIPPPPPMPDWSQRRYNKTVKTEEQIQKDRENYEKAVASLPKYTHDDLEKIESIIEGWLGWVESNWFNDDAPGERIPDDAPFSVEIQTIKNLIANTNAETPDLKAASSNARETVLSHRCLRFGLYAMQIMHATSTQYITGMANKGLELCRNRILFQNGMRTDFSSHIRLQKAQALSKLPKIELGKYFGKKEGMQRVFEFEEACDLVNEVVGRLGAEYIRKLG